MNKQYGNYIEVVPVYAVSTVDNGTITLKSGYSIDKLGTLNNIEPSENAENDDPGTIYKFSLSAGIEKMSDTLKEKYANNPPVILKLYINDGEESITVGTIQNPVRMTRTPSPQYDQLDFSRSSIFPVL